MGSAASSDSTPHAAPACVIETARRTRRQRLILERAARACASVRAPPRAPLEGRPLTLRSGTAPPARSRAGTSPEGATVAARSFSKRVALAMSDSSAFAERAEADETLGFGAGDGSESSSSKSSSP